MSLRWKWHCLVAASLLSFYQQLISAYGWTMYATDANGFIDSISQSGAVTTVANVSGVFWGLTSDSAGNVYFDDGASSIYQLTPTGTLSLLVSGSGLNNPTVMTYNSSDNNLYVYNRGDGNVLRVTLGGAVTTLTNPGVSTEVEGFATDTSGVMYLSDGGEGGVPTIYKITTAGVVSPFVTLGNNVEADGLAFDSLGNLYSSQWTGSTVVRITPSGVITTYASSGFNGPTGPILDGSNNLYVANYFDGTVTLVQPDGTTITNWATGLGNPGYLILVSTPEPSALWCLLVGLAGLIFFRRFSLCRR